MHKWSWDLHQLSDLLPAHTASNCPSLLVSVSHLRFPKGELSSLHHKWRWGGGGVPPTAPRSPQEAACSREGPGSPYLRDELEEGVGVEGSNRQSYEVEQEPLVKSLLHEGHNAGPQEGAEGDDGHTEETVPPHCHGGGGASPTRDRDKGQRPRPWQPPLGEGKWWWSGREQSGGVWLTDINKGDKREESERDKQRGREKQNIY